MAFEILKTLKVFELVTKNKYIPALAASGAYFFLACLFFLLVYVPYFSLRPLSILEIGEFSALLACGLGLLTHGILNLLGFSITIEEEARERELNAFKNRLSKTKDPADVLKKIFGIEVEDKDLRENYEWLIKHVLPQMLPTLSHSMPPTASPDFHYRFWMDWLIINNKLLTRELQKRHSLLRLSIPFFGSLWKWWGTTPGIISERLLLPEKQNVSVMKVLEGIAKDQMIDQELQHAAHVFRSRLPQDFLNIPALSR